MVAIFGNWGRIRTWINKRIRIKSVANTFVGEDSGKITTGNYNNFIGYEAGFRNIAGYNNNFIGYRAGYSNTGGNANNFVGYQAALFNTIGISNNFIGYQAGYSNINGHYNTIIGHMAGRGNNGDYNAFMGHTSGYSNTSGENNTYIGSKAGYSCATGWRGIHIGYEAGYYETSGDKLIIDNDKRADTAAEQANAMLYGLFAAAGAADQRLSINARLLVRTVPEYANNAAAVTGGLATGEVYRSADYLKIVH